MGNENGPTVHQINTVDLLRRVSTFAHLSAGTEFGSYRDPQWRFLLSGGEITAFAIESEEDDENDAARPCFDGCVLRVDLGNNTHGFGMVLVRPTRRGQGLATAMLKKAMQADMQAAIEGGKRFILAVCSSLGQPLYRKLGFKDSGIVTALTCSVTDMRNVQVKHFDNECLTVSSGKKCSDEQLTLLFDHDTRATGMDRKDRIKLLLNGYAEGSYSTVALLSTSGVDPNNDLSTAIARQDCADGPLIIGPMSGKEECCLPLMHALIEKHFTGGGDFDNVPIMMMVTDHPSLVSVLLEVEGMKKLWSCPAMTSDGQPVYQNGDGSYLAMMHPTLG